MGKRKIDLSETLEATKETLGKATATIGKAKDTLGKEKDTAVAKVASTLDANGDGTIDIQDVIILAVKTPGVHISRDKFLRKELFKNYPPEVVDDAVARTPALAGIPAEEISKIADEVINFERVCVSGISTALGMPGGAAMAATIPADLAQYYAIRSAPFRRCSICMDSRRLIPMKRASALTARRSTVSSSVWAL